MTEMHGLPGEVINVPTVGIFKEFLLIRRLWLSERYVIT